MYLACAWRARGMGILPMLLILLRIGYGGWKTPGMFDIVHWR